MYRAWMVAVLISSTTACRSPWTAVLHGMQTDRVLVALNTDGNNYGARAPSGFTPSRDDRWVLFYYDANASRDVHQAFGQLADDCYCSVEVAPDGVTRDVGVCAFERVPPPPQDQPAP